MVVDAHATAAAADVRRDVVVMCPGVVIGPVMTKAHTKASPLYVREVKCNATVNVL